jgi:uncharacterized membrane protein
MFIGIVSISLEHGKVFGVLFLQMLIGSVFGCFGKKFPPSDYWKIVKKEWMIFLFPIIFVFSALWMASYLNVIVDYAVITVYAMSFIGSFLLAVAFRNANFLEGNAEMEAKKENQETEE